MVAAGAKTAEEDAGVADKPLNLIDVALLTFQVRVTFCPAVILAGTAVNSVITGALSDGGTALELLTELPLQPLIETATTNRKIHLIPMG